MKTTILITLLMPVFLTNTSAFAAESTRVICGMVSVSTQGNGDVEPIYKLEELLGEDLTVIYRLYDDNTGSLRPLVDGVPQCVQGRNIDMGMNEPSFEVEKVIR